MRFVFRLEKMLNFIRLNETVKKMEVAASVQKIGFLQGRKNALNESIRSLLEKTRDGLSIGMDWVYFQNSKIENDLNEIKKTDVMRAEEQHKLGLLRIELSKITMRKKALESLRDKRLREFRLQQGRRVQKQLDDIYQLTRGRR